MFAKNEMSGLRRPMNYNPREFLEQFSDTELPAFARTLLPAAAAPKSGETAVVALECPRTAALCFDRVWSIPLDETECPKEIGFHGTSDAELVAALFLHVKGHSQTEIEEFSEFDEFARAVKRCDLDALSRPRFMAVYSMWLLTTALRRGVFTERPEIPLMQAVSRTLCNGIEQSLERRVVPVYESEAARDAEFAPGDRDVVVAALRQLEVVDEESLSWEQVLEFRRDSGARTDYRRLVHWLDSDMVGRSRQYVVDGIGVRLDSYRNAIKKHGLKSRMGVLASVLDAKALLPAAVAAGGSLAAGEPAWGALAAGGLLLGKVLVAVGQSRVDLHEIREEHSEVAFVAQVSERLTNP